MTVSFYFHTYNKFSNCHLIGFDALFLPDMRLGLVTSATRSKRRIQGLASSLRKIVADVRARRRANGGQRLHSDFERGILRDGRLVAHLLGDGQRRLSRRAHFRHLILQIGDFGFQLVDSPFQLAPFSLRRRALALQLRHSREDFHDFQPKLFHDETGGSRRLFFSDGVVRSGSGAAYMLEG